MILNFYKIQNNILRHRQIEKRNGLTFMRYRQRPFVRVSWMNENLKACLIILGMLIIFLVALGFANETLQDRISELGNSICKERYNLTYESYYYNILSCKEIPDAYDGIKIKVN